MKVKNFVWLVYQNRIQTVDNLERKKWKGSKLCQLCNKEDSVDHLMFHCPLATFMWSVISDGMNWDSILKSGKNFNNEFIEHLYGALK
jgi:hypothetical protein